MQGKESITLCVGDVLLLFWSFNIRTVYIPFQLATHQEVFIHPSSSLFDRRLRPQYVLYSELVHTNKCYIR